MHDFANNVGDLVAKHIDAPDHPQRMLRRNTIIIVRASRARHSTGFLIFPSPYSPSQRTASHAVFFILSQRPPAATKRYRPGPASSDGQRTKDLPNILDAGSGPCGG
jgi:hypothetical protein